MSQQWRRFLQGVCVLGLLLQPASLRAGQTAPATPAGPRAVGATYLHLNVANLDRSLALYRDVLGFEVTTPPAQPRAGTNLVNEPGAMLRTVVLKAQGGSFRLELVEWSGTTLRPQQPRIQDPGAIMMAVRTTRLDEQLAAARRLGLTVLTAGGEPLVGGGRSGQSRAIVIRDADGFVVELLQLLGDAAPGAVADVSVFLTVADLAQTVTFYNSSLGFAMAAPAAAQPASDRIRTLFGEPSITSIRSVRGSFPGSDVTFEFQEFGAADRRPVRHRVQDPGGPILPVTVQELPAVVERVKAAGGIVGAGETSVALAPDARSTWVRDPNGLLLQLSLPRPRN